MDLAGSKVADTYGGGDCKYNILCPSVYPLGEGVGKTEVFGSNFGCTLRFIGNVPTHRSLSEDRDCDTYA